MTNYAMLKSISGDRISFEIVTNDQIPAYFHKTDTTGNIAVYATKSFLARNK